MKLMLRDDNKLKGIDDGISKLGLLDSWLRYSFIFLKIEIRPFRIFRISYIEDVNYMILWHDILLKVILLRSQGATYITWLTILVSSSSQVNNI